MTADHLASAITSFSLPVLTFIGLTFGVDGNNLATLLAPALLKIANMNNSGNSAVNLCLHLNNGVSFSAAISHCAARQKCHLNTANLGRYRNNVHRVK